MKLAWTRPRSWRTATLLTWSMASVVLLTVLLMTLVDIFQAQKRFRQEVEEKGRLLAGTVNDLLADALYFGDVERLRHLSEAIAAQPDVEEFTVFTPEGRIVVDPRSTKFSTGQVSDDVLRALHDGDLQIRFDPDRVEIIGPIRVAADVVGGIQIAFDAASFRAELRETVWSHAGQGLGLMLLGVVLAYGLAKTLTAPVQQLVRITDRIAGGNFDFSLDERRNTEIGELAESLERMAERLKESTQRRAEEQHARLREANERLTDEVEQRKSAQRSSEESNRRLSQALDQLQRAQQSIIQQERLRAVGELASGIAHDVNNRLQVVLGLSENLLLHPPPGLEKGQARADLSTIADSARAATQVVQRLKRYYRPGSEGERFTPIDLAEVVTEAVSLTEPRWRDQALGRGVNIDVVVECEEAPPVSGEAAELREALINLIFNAVDAIPRAGTVTVRVYPRHEKVVLEVRDSGLGMSEQTRSHCLTPFFTTKGTSGSGLGLALVDSTVKRHGGRLEIETEQGRGTTVRVCFPVSQEPLSRQVSDSATPSATPLRILLVDDEPVVRSAVEALLVHDRHLVTTAADGKEALELFRSEEIDLVITDRAMPVMNGLLLAETLSRIAPNTPVIMLSGFGSLMSATAEHPIGVDLILAKPMGLDDLRSALRKLIGDRRPVEPLGHENLHE